MWTVIYVAPSASTAERIKDRLTEEGFLVKIKSSHGKQFEVLVPESELDDVRDELAHILQ